MELAKIDKRTGTIKTLCPVCWNTTVEKWKERFICSNCGFSIPVKQIDERR